MIAQLSPRGIFWVKALVLVLCVVPFARLIWDASQGTLGANPVETLEHGTGDWSLRFLLLTLSITPLRVATGANWVVRLRRILGLYAFFYLLLHFAIYFVFDQGLDPTGLWKDLLKRPFISTGFVAMVLLAPLAATSTDRMIRRLGRRWKSLHRLVYVAALLGVLHYFLLVKADISEPLAYGATLGFLLAFRLLRWLPKVRGFDRSTSLDVPKCGFRRH